MSDDAFARQFQAAATEVIRLYSTAYTLMEIEMGSGPAQSLAPRYLGDIVASAERLAITRLNAEQIATVVEEEEQAMSTRTQLTIDDALAQLPNGGAPW